MKKTQTSQRVIDDSKNVLHFKYYIKFIKILKILNEE